MNIREWAYIIQKTIFATFNVLACWDAIMHDWVDMFFSMAMVLLYGLILKFVFGEEK